MFSSVFYKIFTKFLRTPISKNTCERLLLLIESRAVQEIWPKLVLMVITDYGKMSFRSKGTVCICSRALWHMFQYYFDNLEPPCCFFIHATPQIGQTHLNSSSALADELFECVWPFCGVGAQRVKCFTNGDLMWIHPKQGTCDKETNSPSFVDISIFTWFYQYRTTFSDWISGQQTKICFLYKIFYKVLYILLD